jgi:flagellar biosynthesis protein
MESFRLSLSLPRSGKLDEVTGREGMSEQNRRSSRDNDTKKAQRQVAVALSHDLARPDAPRVVASGRGAIAEQIIQLAFAHGIKVREDADLAELLSIIEIDNEIPPEAFLAVSEILIYIYRANGLFSSGRGPVR